jgi:glyoxylase-like metal-dependent hydrolase (beta-lactamase superfamily II)
MSNRWLPLLAVVASVPVQAVLSQDRSPAALISAALDGLGGVERIRALRSIEVHGVGVEYRSAQVQGSAPDRQTPTAREEWLTVDRVRGRVAEEYHAARHDGSDRWRRFVYGADTRMVVDRIRGFASEGRFPDAGAIGRDLTRRIPHLLLLEALDRPAELTDRGDTVVAGAPERVVGYRAPDHETELRLAFEPASHRLVAIRYPVRYAGIGDTEVEIRFDRYRPDSTLGAFPAGHTISIGGKPFQRVGYRTVLADAPSSAARFELPEELAAGLVRPGSVVPVAAGIYLAHGFAGFTTMFAEFRDFVLAVEAPAAGYAEFDQIPVDRLAPPDSISAAIVAAIKRTVPNKPIRFLAVSHFHNDHAGGAASFLAEGATLLTTPGNRSYFARLLGSEGRAVPIETVATSRTITDGERTVILRNVGFTPHTDEALVVYFPKERILYQGDQFYFDGDYGFPPSDRLGVMQQFGSWLLRSGLGVDRIYGTHMIGYATMRHVRRVLALPPVPRRTAGG